MHEGPSVDPSLEAWFTAPLHFPLFEHARAARGDDGPVHNPSRRWIRSQRRSLSGGTGVAAVSSSEAPLERGFFVPREVTSYSMLSSMSLVPEASNAILEKIVSSSPGLGWLKNVLSSVAI